MAKSTKAKTKKTTTKKTKKPASSAKKTTDKRKSQPAVAQSPFFQVRITDQSLYWLIFGIVSIAFALWIYTLDARVRDLYDQIDANTYSADSAMMMKANKQKAAEAAQ